MNYDEKVKQLAVARADHEAATVWNFDSTVKAIDAELRDAALADYHSSQVKKLHPAVTVKVFKVAEFDADAALRWAKDSARTLLKLDTKGYEKALKNGIFEGMPGYVTEEPRITVARDLSKFVAESAAESVGG
jgi:hypothetical protein